MMPKVRWQRWSDGAQRYVNCLVHWDDDGKILNARNIARNSSIGWGAWQFNRKLKATVGECWGVSTAGHGGLILVTNEKLSWMPEPERGYGRCVDLSDPYTLDGQKQRYRCYVYVFEEDCDWAIAVYNDPLIAASACGTYLNVTTPEEARSRAIESLHVWNRPHLREEDINRERYDDCVRRDAEFDERYRQHTEGQVA